jgi:hypothetical protein
LRPPLTFKTELRGMLLAALNDHRIAALGHERVAPFGEDRGTPTLSGRRSAAKRRWRALTSLIPE